MNLIHGQGPSSAKLAIVGEYPNKFDLQCHKPFSGVPGRIVNDYLVKAGSNINHCYLTNVIRSFSEIFSDKERSIPESDSELLWMELNTLQPNAVIALGNLALKALTGYTGIDKYRGSILPAMRGSFKVIPTIHPASITGKESDGKMKGWKDGTFIQWDFNRAVAQSNFKEYLPPIRNLVVCRSNLDLYRFFNRFSNETKVAVDIETFHTIPICISFAFNSTEAISVPLFPSLNPELRMSRGDTIQNWKDIVEIMADSKIQKIGQNFKFDETLLKRCLNDTTNFGILTRGFYFDTMLAFRTLYPELSGSLAFQTSVLTEEPYYKEEGKGYNPKKDKIERLLLYNAKDAVVTFECHEKELSELSERKLEEFFFERVMPLHPFYSRLEQRGIRRDNFAQKYLREKYEDQEKELSKELNELTLKYEVEKVNVNSPKQIGLLLYVAMKLPIRKGTGEKEIDALLRNTVKDQDKRRILELILKIRKVKKTLGTYVNAEVFADGRYRTSYRIMLETGRTSTSVCAPPITTDKMGLAFQTITKHGETGSDLRSLMIPDEGYIFIEPDLSQAEARVVALLADDEKLLKMFKYGVDIHRVTSAWLENRPIPLLEVFFKERLCPEKIAAELNAQLKGFTSEDERQKGKKFRHSGHYDMQKHEASIQLGISEREAGIGLLTFHNTNENIKKVFHAGIIECLNKFNRILVNPFGRARQFLNKWGNDLFKEAYAQIPQSTVSDQVKFAMLRIEPRCKKMMILQESHDSFLAQIMLAVGEMYPFKYLDNYAEIIKEELEVPINFDKCSLGKGDLIIPCDIKIGKKNWLEMESYKI
jgi:uracil-DNA glycosylase family 4